MSVLEQLREDVKSYIDVADERILRLIHAMVEADSQADFWNELPQNIQEDVETAIQQSEKGEGKSTEEVMKPYARWLTQ